MDKKIETKMLQRQAYMTIGKNIGVDFSEMDELGYTTDDGIIHISWNHEIMDGLNEEYKILFRRGVFAHELLHQVYTNFRYTKKICKDLSLIEQKIFMTFANTLEDPAIEYFAPNVLGEDMLTALKFSIRHIYIKSPTIEHSKSAFGQMVNALINFGDMGLIRGNFTFPKAEEYFVKVCPKYNEGIECPDNVKRLDIARECMEITRPLWEEEFADEIKFEEFLKELTQEFMQQQMSDGCLDIQSDSPSSSGCDDGRSDARNESAQALSEAMQNSETDSSSDGQSGNSSTSSDKQSGSEKSSFGDSSSDEQVSKQAASTENAIKQIQASKETANEAAESLIDQAKEKETTERIKNSVKKELQKEKDSLIKKESKDDFHIEEIEKKVSSRNSVVRPDNYSLAAYNKLCNACASDINRLSKTLKKLFEQDADEYIPFISGRYDVVRGAKGTTAKIFNKKRNPSNLSDMEVILVIDTSGSMNGENIANAQISATMLTEACAKVGVPCYVMGFSSGAHTHYASWKYSRNQASSIAKMSANGGTDDTTAVRYATEVLNQHKAEHCFMFIISDGCGNGGLKQAVIDARKKASVFAIGIGNIDEDYFSSVYGSDFLHVNSPRGLATKISNKLIKLVKRHAS